MKLEDDNFVDDHDIALSINQTPFHVATYILWHSEMPLKNVVWEIDDFHSIIVHYRDTDCA